MGQILLSTGTDTQKRTLNKKTTYSYDSRLGTGTWNMWLYTQK